MVRMIRPWAGALCVMAVGLPLKAQDADTTEAEDERWWDPETTSEWDLSWSSPEFSSDTGTFTLDLIGGYRSLAARKSDAAGPFFEGEEYRAGEELYAMANVSVPFEALFGGRSGPGDLSLGEQRLAAVEPSDATRRTEAVGAMTESKEGSTSATEEAAAVQTEPSRRVPLSSDDSPPSESRTEEERDPVSNELLMLATREIVRRVGGSEDGADLRLKSLVRRSRWSGLSPELRLRGVMGFDETISTDDAIGVYPGDTSTRGGRDSLAEARLTFRLDRLVLGDGEDSIERQRIQLLGERRKLNEEAILLFLQWRSSRLRAQDTSLAPDDVFKAQMGEESALVQLHLLTGGWFVGEPTLRLLEKDVARLHEPAPSAQGAR